MCKRWLPEVFPAVLVYGIPLMSFGRDIICRPWPLLNLPLRQKEQGLRPSQGILPTQQRAHSKRLNFQPRQESTLLPTRARGTASLTCTQGRAHQ